MSFRRLTWFSVCTSGLVLAWECTIGQMSSLSSHGYSGSADSQLSGNSPTILVTSCKSLGSKKAVLTDDLTRVAFKSSVELTPSSVSLSTETKACFGKAKDPGNGWRGGFGGDHRGMNTVISSSGVLKGVGHNSFPVKRALRE